MDKFEEYKLFVEDTARFTDRRQTANNIYVAVNSIFLGSSGAMLGQMFTGHRFFGLFGGLIAAVGFVICLQWRQLIEKYKKLVSFRIEQLRKMEKEEAMKDSHQMYHKEDEIYPRNEDGKMLKGRGLNFSDREKWLPVTFAFIYVIFFIAAIVKTFFLT